MGQGYSLAVGQGVVFNCGAGGGALMESSISHLYFKKSGLITHVIIHYMGVCDGKGFQIKM